MLGFGIECWEVGWSDVYELMKETGRFFYRRVESKAGKHSVSGVRAYKADAIH